MDKGLKVLGVVVTVLYLAGVCWYVSSNLAKFAEMDPNAVGDFLAGAFSPLAFLWLVLGFYQQGEELRLQVTEMTKSVEQQTALANISMEQLAHDRELAERPFRPMLTVTFQGCAANTERYSLAFDIRNTGADIFKVNCKFLGVLSDFRYSHEELRRDVSMSVSVELEKLFHPWRETLMVAYVDGLKRPGLLAFEIVMTEGDNTVSVDISEIGDPLKAEAERLSK